MSHSVFWHVENRVCVVQAWGNVSLDELPQISQALSALIQAGDAPVHWIVDARQIKSIPKSLGQVQRMAKVFNEPNLGWVLALTDNHFMKFATSLVSQLSRVDYKVFDNPITLINTLQLIDPSLATIDAYEGQLVKEDI